MSGYECLYLIPKAQYESFQSQGDRVVRDGVASINIRQLNNIGDAVRATIQANDVTRGGGQKNPVSNAAVSITPPVSGGPSNFGQVPPSTEVGENFGQIRERGVNDLLPPPRPVSPVSLPRPSDDPPATASQISPPTASETPAPHVLGDNIFPADNTHTHESVGSSETSFTQLDDDFTPAPSQTDSLGASTSSQTNVPSTHSVGVSPLANGSIWDFTSRKRRRTGTEGDERSVEPEKEKPKGHRLSAFSPPEARITTPYVGKMVSGTQTDTPLERPTNQQATQTDVPPPETAKVLSLHRQEVVDIPPTVNTTQSIAVQTRRQRPNFIVAKKPMTEQGMQTDVDTPPPAAVATVQSVAVQTRRQPRPNSVVAKKPMTAEQSAQTHETLASTDAVTQEDQTAGEATVVAVKPSWQFKKQLPPGAQGQRMRRLGIGLAKKIPKQEEEKEEEREAEVPPTQTLLDTVLPSPPKKVSRKKRPPQKFSPEPIRKRAAPLNKRGAKKVVPPPAALDSDDEEMRDENPRRGKRLKKKSAVMLSYLQSKKEGANKVKPRWIPTARRAKKPKLLADQHF